MNCNDFINVYWKNYILIEKEFLNTLDYIALSKENYSSYSPRYIKLILEIGSEIDITLKEFCKYLDSTFTGSKMPEYQKLINKAYKNISNQKVVLLNGETLIPWKDRFQYSNNGNMITSLAWWYAYNKVKHERNDIVTFRKHKVFAYKLANLEHCLNSLAFLYQILVDYYREIAIKEKKNYLIPLPGSRLFKLSGDDYDSIDFVFDNYFDIDPKDGHLYMGSSAFPY